MYNYNRRNANAGELLSGSETLYNVLQFSPGTLQGCLVDGSLHFPDRSCAWSIVQGIERSPIVDTDDYIMINDDVVMIKIIYFTYELQFDENHSTL